MDASASSSASSSPNSSMCDAEPEDAPACWICLEGARADVGTPRRMCRCPALHVHPVCMSRWQLRKAGTREECFCRFCDEKLPDWRTRIQVPAPVTAPVMTICHNGRPVVMRPEPGPEGLAKFKKDLARVLGLKPGTDIKLVFECVEPFSGERVTLKGCETYDAAIHCASVSAAKEKGRA